MNQVTNSISWELPCCSSNSGEQTGYSIGLRVTAVALGAIVAIAGILVLLHVPGFSHFGTTEGWIALSVGTFVALVGIAIKCVRNQSNKEEEQFHPTSSKNPLFVPQDSGPENLALIAMTTHQRPITNIKERYKFSDTLAKLNEQELFSPTWCQRIQLDGYNNGKFKDFTSCGEILENVILCAGAHIPEIKQINLFPLCYKVQEEEQKISVDLSSHIEVINNHILSVKTGEDQYYAKPTPYLFTDRLQKEESFVLTDRQCRGQFEMEGMPGMLFVTSHNGVQCEIGYLNVFEILGRQVKFSVQEDYTISYTELSQ